jgi:hypothetical protein
MSPDRKCKLSSNAESWDEMLPPAIERQQELRRVWRRSLVCKPEDLHSSENTGSEMRGLGSGV